MAENNQYGFTIPIGSSEIITVVSVSDCIKEVPKKGGGMMCRYDVVIKNREGLATKSQYLAPLGAPVDMVPGAYQKIRCLEIYPWGEMSIVPGEMQIVDGTKIRTENKTETHTPLGQLDNMYVTKVPGTIACFSIAYAKDLLTAEMAHWPLGKEVSPEDINRMLGNATLIADRMYEMVTT